MNPSGFTFSKFLGGAYKTLNLANQIIPLYQQISPMVKQARSAFSIIKEINLSNKTPHVNNNYKTKSNNNISKKKELPLNNPTFFH